MRSLMAQTHAGMSEAEFSVEYPKIAGPVQLGKDAARSGGCPGEIGIRVQELYRRIDYASKSAETNLKWNRDYDTLDADIAALP
jgi:hypothetical protein